MASPRDQPWLVKRDGPCSECGIVMPQGSSAVWNQRTRKMRHVECPPDAVASDPVTTPSETDIDYGTAGRSAQLEYERRLAKDKAATRAKWGRLAGLVQAWNGEKQSISAWSSGAEGEIKVANALAGLTGVAVLHDRGLRGSRRNLDLLAIGPAGVFVIDAKNHGGTVRIRDKGSFFRSDKRLYVGGRDRSKLAEDMGWQVEAVSAALTTADIDPLPSITPVLCFASADWPWLFPPDSFRGVHLEALNSLKKLVVQKQELDDPAIERYTRILADAFPPK